MKADEIKLQELHDPESLDQVFELEQIVWDMGPAEAVSSHIMQAITHNGGVLIGAFDRDKLIGFVFGFPARRGDEWWLWSHMAGVLPAYRSRRVGYRLKQAQRRWALDHGYDEIRWTFDPLQRRNAHFNLRLLGAVPHEYAVNIYGEMTDGINAGMQSDRLIVHWVLQSPRVVAAANRNGEPLPPVVTRYPQDDFLLMQTPSGELIQRETIPDSGCCFVEIPYDLPAVKSDNLARAQQWQLKIRHTIQMALDANFKIVDFASQEGRCWYVMCCDS